MSKNAWFEVTSAIVFCAIAIALFNPMHLWMPSMTVNVMLAVLVAAFGAFVVFVLREQASDEREEAHRSLAGRAAFLAGASVLVLGIALQSLSHVVDPWLVAALLAMVIAKVAAHVWSDRYR